MRPWTAWVPPEGISLRAAAESYFTANGWPEEKRRADFEENTLLFWAALARSVRFGGMRLKDYVNQIDPEKEQQFSAVTVELGEAGTFAAFRGTDNTLVGWKEDFNMGYCARVPSQQAGRGLLGADRGVEYRPPVGRRTLQGGQSCGVRCGQLFARGAGAAGGGLQQRRTRLLRQRPGPGGV